MKKDAEFECAILRDKGRRKMEVLPDFEKRNTILKDFNKLFDDEEAAWRDYFDGKMTDELLK